MRHRYKVSALAIFCVALVLCLLSDATIRYWTFHARLNLLLAGCGFCHLESAGNLEALPVQPSEFVSKLAYKNGAYAGYLNRYGIFVRPNEPPTVPFQKDFQTVVMLFYLRAISGAVFVLVGVYLISKMVSSIRRNRGHCSGDLPLG